MTRAMPLWLLVALQGVVSAASLVVEIVAGRMLAPACGHVALYLDGGDRGGAGGVLRGPLVGRTAGGKPPVAAALPGRAARFWRRR
jgi:hypothetical protein